MKFTKASAAQTAGGKSGEGETSPKQKYNKLYDRIVQFKPPGGVSRVNILLYGAIAAGKSSFVNSVDSMFSGYLSRRAPHGTCHKSNSSVTRNIKRHIFTTIDGSSPQFCLWDSMGWGIQDSKSEELTLIMGGYIPDKTDLRGGVGFRGHNRLNRNPTINEQMHSILFVLSCHDIRNEEYLKKINDLKDIVFASEMQPLVILTMIDECGLDLSEMMGSAKLANLIKELSVNTGIPAGCILPVKNFSEEREICSVVGLWTIEALIASLNNATSFIRTQLSEE